MAKFFFVNLILSGIFLVKLLITADETGDFVVSVIACTFDSLILSDQLGDMGVALVNLHFKGVDVLSKF